MVAGAGAEDDALGHGPGAKALAAQRTVDDGDIRAQVKKLLGHGFQLRGDGRPGQLNVSGAACPDDHHLAQRRGDAGGHQYFLGDIPQPQHILGRGDQGALPDENAGLFRAGHNVGGLAVPANGGQAQHTLQFSLLQQPVEHCRLSGILAHAHDGHGFHAVQLPQKLFFHIASPSECSHSTNYYSG